MVFICFENTLSKYSFWKILANLITNDKGKRVWFEKWVKSSKIHRIPWLRSTYYAGF